MIFMGLFSQFLHKNKCFGDSLEVSHGTATTYVVYRGIQDVTIHQYINAS